MTFNLSLHYPYNVQILQRDNFTVKSKELNYTQPLVRSQYKAPCTNKCGLVFFDRLLSATVIIL